MGSRFRPSPADAEPLAAAGGRAVCAGDERVRHHLIGTRHDEARTQADPREAKVSRATAHEALIGVAGPLAAGRESSVTRTPVPSGPASMLAGTPKDSSPSAASESAASSASLPRQSAEGPGRHTPRRMPGAASRQSLAAGTGELGAEPPTRQRLLVPVGLDQFPAPIAGQDGSVHR